MVQCIADNICSPLGWNTEENFAAVREGRSELRLHDAQPWALQEPFVASLFPQNAVTKRFSDAFPHVKEPLSHFEKLAILSISDAIQKASVELRSPDVIFILASTKGNVELLDDKKQPDIPRDRVRLGLTAEAIARFFGNPNTPLVVSNACISGVHAQILAARLLEMGTYRYAVVCGCDIQSRFIISGFQSFKALSSEPCKPFDRHRDGLNLGEGAATMVLTSVNIPQKDAWIVCNGAVRNDANHISGPSRTGEGSYRALATVCGEQKEQLAFINVHGTATPYNDEMEAIALDRAELLNAPVNALKGYFGHTMGAAGILETILSFRAIEAGIVLPTKGFNELGVSRPVSVADKESPTDKKQFIKLLSGFGGCNGAIRWKQVGNEAERSCSNHASVVHLIPIHRVNITPRQVIVDDLSIETKGGEGDLLTRLYKEKVKDYPKFYKMDGLSKLGLIATELLIQGGGQQNGDCLTENTAIVFIGRSGSLADDRKYQETIQTQKNFFPSPAVFVYTLPNIVTGEVAIKHKTYGETAFYALEKKDDVLIHHLLQTVCCDATTEKIIGGWLEYESEDCFEADLCLYQIGK